MILSAVYIYPHGNITNVFGAGNNEDDFLRHSDLDLLVHTFYLDQ